MNDSEELAEKYHKLFQDYTRIKAQHAVLKKAVLKEQTENATIQAALKEKEQEVRKSLQELDLLSFHNQRLTKRIENLQNQAAAKPGGSWLMGGTSVKKELEKSQSTLEAATIDLQAKIEENEKLHQQLYEINALYPRHVTELQGKIQALEKQNQELQVDVERVGVANEDTINLIRKEKEAVEKELHTTRDALAGQLKDERRVTQSLQNQVQELQQEYDRLSKVERELYSLQSEHSKLEGELETFKWISSELSQLQTSYSALERDKGQVEKAHAQLTQQYGELKQAEEKLRGALMQEQERHRVIQEHHSGLSKQLEATRGEASERERGFHVQIQQLEGELSRAHKEQEQLKVQYEELKAAEQSAKEGESRTKTDLAKELTIMKSDLERAESTIKEMENVKATLEKDLLETKKSLEETSSSLEALRNRRADDSDDAGTKKEEQVSETGEVVDKDKPVEATEAVESSDAQVDEAAKDSKDDNDDAGTTAQDEAAVVSTTTSNADKEADDQKRAQEEQARREVENALRAEIETLKAEIETSQQVNATKDEQLTATLAALESVKDERASMKDSLEMHVDLTMQLQQEIEELRTNLAKKNKSGESRSAGRGAVSREPEQDEGPAQRTQQKNRDIQDARGSGSGGGEHTPQRASTPLPTAGEQRGSNDANGSVKEFKDESTQVETIERSDKSVQSDQVELITESTQADLPVAVNGDRKDPKAHDSTQAEVEDQENKEASSSFRQGIERQPSRRSMIGEGFEVAPTTTDSASAATSTENQAKRESLIKQHYEAKLQGFTEQLQLSDGRYARLHKEFELLKELLMETVQDREKGLKECEQLKEKNAHLKEELEAAREDTRAQVETMTNFMKSIEGRT